MKNIENLTTPTRERTSVPISGLDLSTPDDLVQDGACSHLRNMRYHSNAWRPIHPFCKRQFKGDFDIVYHHPTAYDDIYITSHNGVYGTIRFYDNGSTTTNTIDTIKNVKSIHHFGNVLTFSCDDTDKHYLYTGEKYQQVNAPSKLPRIKITSTDKTYDYEGAECYFGKEVWNGNTLIFAPYTPYPLTVANSYLPNFDDNDLKNNSITIVHSLYSADQGILPSTYKGDSFYGNICFLVTCRMVDGSHICVSPLYMSTRDEDYLFAKVGKGYISPNTGNLSSPKNTFAKTDKIDLIEYKSKVDKSSALIYRKLKLTVSAPTDLLSQDSLVESIAIYASRVFNPFDIQFLKQMKEGEDFDFADAYNTEDIFNSPLYLLKEYNKDDFKDKTEVSGYKSIDFDVTREMLDNALTNEIYTPSYTTPITGNVVYDYNQRSHLGDVSVNYLASPNANAYAFFQTGGSSTVERYRKFGVTVESNGENIHLLPNGYKKTGDALFAPLRILSYPDVAVKAFLNHIETNLVASYTCKQSYANGFSYYTKPPTNASQFPSLGLLDDYGDFSTSKTQSGSVRQPNRIQVSASNTPFVFPNENSYRVGNQNNRILAMQSTAIKLADEQVGSLPLYVFTEEGIYALRAGNSTLYSAINPINYDKIINPSTIAINGAVAYITEKGVHLLTDEGSTVISTPVHGNNGMPNLNMLRNCTLLHSKQFNEIILLDNIGDEHYVYNIGSGFWSTRELDGAKINTDELVDNNNKLIYDLSNEDENAEGLSATIVTRPVKLGNVEYKRLETIIPRMNTGSSNCLCDIYVDASQDGNSYGNLISYEDTEVSSNVNNPLVFRRVPYSAKYYKFGINLYHLQGEDSFDPSISHIDIEWYRRFSRRMR